jgi:hypothetical protein
MFRRIAAAFLGLALVVAAVDLWPAITGGGALRLAALGEWWAWIDRDSLLLLQPAVERHLSPAIWDPGIQTLLEWPLALELAALAGLFWLLRARAPERARRKRDLDLKKRK